ncbi:hypothetical protein [Candidatus Berkiella aquae]|uniref:Right handed beta helix domain-containing protein n=1 Tax=Candidatus Berkiella aquae TaxID=295108 RepID=A0A0Q9YIW7_9GAMM|nr:hypothetical protein [Candidatus Berkiella aquae]MCS5710149.1 hypothetical protein [Candidatus Berkiella aquae]
MFKVHLLFLLVYTCYATALFAKTICVDANTSVLHGNGSCWESPYQDLQQALDAATDDKDIHEIWVAKGVYRPTKTYAPENHQHIQIVGGAFSQKQYNPGITFKQKLTHYQQDVKHYQRCLRTFSLIDGVSIYGGFKGHEKTRTQRSPDIEKNATILEGDYAIWHVLTAGNDITRKGVKVTLDRLVIQHGDANQAPYYPTHFPLYASQIPIYYHDDGGGLYIFAHSQITLNHVRFLHNHAIAGGAIFVQDGSKLIINQCEFRHNQAQNGAAINIRHGGPNEFTPNAKRRTEVIIHHTRFLQNHSEIGPAILTNDNQSVIHRE